MTSGHPDFQTPQGRGVTGEEITNYSFSGSIDGETLGGFNLPAVAAGWQYFITNLTISCNDDEAIHLITLNSTDRAWAFFLRSFILGADLDIPGQVIAAGDIVVINITNNHTSAKTFLGSVTWVKRKL